jgi:hypothetical protein
MRDPGLVARAQRAATRLEPAWDGADRTDLWSRPGQPVVGYDD